jgi:hypothetical protein
VRLDHLLSKEICNNRQTSKTSRVRTPLSFPYKLIPMDIDNGIEEEELN